MTQIYFSCFFHVRGSCYIEPRWLLSICPSPSISFHHTFLFHYLHSTYLLGKPMRYLRPLNNCLRGVRSCNSFQPLAQSLNIRIRYSSSFASTCIANQSKVALFIGTRSWRSLRIRYGNYQYYGALGGSERAYEEEQGRYLQYVSHLVAISIMQRTSLIIV